MSSAGTEVDPAGSAAGVARRVFDAINRHDLTAIRACLHPDDYQTFLPAGTFDGADAVVDYFSSLFAAFPDFSITIERLVAEEDAAWVRWRAAGTFSGEPFLGIRATGRRVEVLGVDARIELQDRLIRFNTIFYDGAAFLRGVGMLPARGSRGERFLIGAFNLLTRLRRRARRRVP
jgi:predicted ester cyclase